jgi:phospholipid/cholesterol/gamma-HCH transport system permease protein
MAVERSSENSWVASVGQRALASPSGMRHRWRFWRATVTAALTVPRSLKPVVHRETMQQMLSAGLRQLPLIVVLGVALGLLVVGQAVTLLRHVSAQHYMGTVMVAVVMRELGPLMVAFVLAARAGTATVVDLGAMRLRGGPVTAEHVGAQALRLVVAPRLRAFAVASVCLAVYLIFLALGSGYLVAFLQNVPLRFEAYCGQLADSLRWMDFVLVLVKSALFGVVIAVVSCYHGLERLLRIEEFSTATTHAVVESLSLCVVLDAVFLTGYLVR